MIDIAEGLDGDIIMSDDGDIVYAESTRMHQKDIILSRPGEYRLAPASTVGAIDYLDDEDEDNLNASIRVKFKKDGMTVSKIINGSNGKLEIVAKYE